jgi:hypothetical protein
MAGNQFYVQPAGDMSQGLQGLGQALRYASEKREEDEAAEAKRVADAEAQSALYDAYQTNDPNLLMEAAIKYPQISQQAGMALGLQKDFQKQEAADFASQVLANPAQAAEIAQKRIALLEMQGRDPTHTIDFLETLQQDPEAAMRGLEMNFAAINPESYKAYRDSMPAAAEQVKGIEVGGSVVNLRCFLRSKPNRWACHQPAASRSTKLPAKFHRSVARKP